MEADKSLIETHCSVCGMPYLIALNDKATCRADGKRVYRADRPDDGWCDIRCVACKNDVSECVSGAEYE
jgi:hypothetical protein